IEPVLLEVKPVVQAWMRSAGADLAAVEIRKPVDADIGPHHQRMVDLIDCLPEVDPGVAARAMAVGRDVVAADKLDLARRHRTLRLARGDVAVVLDREPMLLPGP